MSSNQFPANFVFGGATAAYQSRAKPKRTAKERSLGTTSSRSKAASPPTPQATSTTSTRATLSFASALA